MRTKTLTISAGILCLFAVGCASAYAANYFPTEKAGPEHAFEVKAGETVFTAGKTAAVACKEATFTGTTPSKTGSSTQDVVPTFSGCKANILEGATKTTFVNEHCKIEYYSQILLSPGVYAEQTGFVENGGTCHMKFIIVSGLGTCEVIVQSQKELKGSEQTDFKTLGMEVKSALVGITYKVTPLCEAVGVIGGTEGKFTGTAKTEALFIE